MRSAATTFVALFVTISVAAIGSTPAEPPHYVAQVRLTAGHTLVLDKPVELVDRHSFIMRGTAKGDSKIGYDVELTPYAVTGDRVGLSASVMVETQGPSTRVISGGKVLSLPSTTTCSVRPKAILNYNTPVKMAATSSGVNDDDGRALPECAITVTISKPQGSG